MAKILISFFMFLSALYAEVLDVSKAFSVTHAKDSQNLEISFKFGENIYIYNETFEIKLNGEKINEFLNMPRTEISNEHAIIPKDFTLFIPFGLIEQMMRDNAAKLEISYQGCAKDGICYRPQLKIFEISKSGATFNVRAANKSEAKDAPQAENLGELSDEQHIASRLGGANFIIALATFLGYGLLLSLTPCVFPMIPILSSIIVKKSAGAPSAKKGFLLSLVYVLAMSLAYALAGVAASALGFGVQGALQNVWILGVFAAVFVALALSMFGFYDIKMPAKFENLISRKSRDGAGYAGVFVMGFASALVISPCVAAPLAGALLYIAQSGNALFGGLALFTMGLGMGAPLLLIGASSGKILPRPGAWMDGIKTAFGFLLLAMAVWLLARVLGSGFELAGYGLIGVFWAVYLGAFEAAGSGALKFKKALAILVFIYSLALILGASTGAKDALNPLESLKFSGTADVKGELNFKTARNLSELNEIIKTAQNPVMIDFYADWCASCKELEKITFKDAAVSGKLANFTLIRVDVTEQSEQNDAMLRNFGLIDPPAILFFKDGAEIAHARTIGFINPQGFLKKLNKIL